MTNIDPKAVEAVMNGLQLDLYPDYPPEAFREDALVAIQSYHVYLASQGMVIQQWGRPLPSPPAEQGDAP